MSQKVKLPVKKTVMRFYKGNLYTCEKISFKTRKEAFEGIREGDDDIFLRPYKCDRCECWHLTHKKSRSLWSDNYSNKAINPNIIIYWIKWGNCNKESLFIKTNLVCRLC